MKTGSEFLFCDDDGRGFLLDGGRDLRLFSAVVEDGREVIDVEAVDTERLDPSDPDDNVETEAGREGTCVC